MAHDWPEDRITRAVARRQQIGIEPLIYRTLAEFEAAVAKCRQALETETGERLPALIPSEAAWVFLKWIRAHHREGRYPSADFSALYTEHCEETNRMPTGENWVRAALSRMPNSGVSKTQVDGKSEHGKRVRNNEWIIGSEPPVQEHAISQLRLAA